MVFLFIYFFFFLKKKWKNIKYIVGLFIKDIYIKENILYY